VVQYNSLEMAPEKGEFTRILGELERGDPSAAERLLPLVYDELRALAGEFFSRRPAGHTLQPTALVHEFFLRISGNEAMRWESRAHFMAVAARAMRQILINHARDKGAAKRGGGRRVTLDEALSPPVGERREIDLIELDLALGKLAALSERQARIVEARFFGGLTIAECAQVLGVGTTTVEDDWRLAKAWLARELRGRPPR
jgi:RNA polymerase sigma factor (TIGR02999 family)